MNIRHYSALALAACLAAAVTPASAAVTFYGTKAAFDGAASTVLIEDFDSFVPKDTNIFSSVTRGIATYTPFAPAAQPNLVVTGSTYNNFGTNLNPFNGTVLTTSGDEDIQVSFSVAQTAVGFDGYLNGLGPGTVKVFDGATLLATLDLADPAGGGETYVGIVSTTSFDAFRWTTTAGGVLNTAIDTISVSNVPEPGTVALMVAGLFGIGAVAGRRSRWAVR